MATDWATLRRVYACLFVDILAVGLIVPLITPLTRDLGASATTIGLLQSSYGVLQLASSPIVGAASDAVSRRWALVACTLGGLVGYELLAVTGSVVGVAVSRVIVGIFRQFSTVTKALVSELSTSDDRSAAIGYIYAIFGLAFSVGPAAGGIIAHRYGIRWALQLACVLFAANAFLVTALLPRDTHLECVTGSEVNGSAGKAPKGSSGTGSGSSGSGSNGVGNAVGGTDSVGAGTAALLSAAAPLTAAKRVWESMSSDVQRLLTVGLCMSWSTMLLRSSVSLLLEYKSFDGADISVQDKGLVISLFSVVGMVSQLVVVPRVARLAPERRLVTAGAVGVAAGSCGVALAASVHALFAALAVVAVSSAVLDSNYHSVLTKAATCGRFGAVLGLSGTVESVTRALSPFASGLLLEHAGPGAPAAVAAFFGVMTAACAVRAFSAGGWVTKADVGGGSDDGAARGHKKEKAS